MVEEKAKLLTIGELARTNNLTLRTLRFYEQSGLLRPTRIGNKRYYSAGDRIRLEMVRKGKLLGFSIREIGMMLDVKAEPPPVEAGIYPLGGPEGIERQIVRLEDQKARIEEALRELREAAVIGPERADELEGDRKAG